MILLSIYSSNILEISLFDLIIMTSIICCLAAMHQNLYFSCVYYYYKLSKKLVLNVIY